MISSALQTPSPSSSLAMMLPSSQVSHGNSRNTQDPSSSVKAGLKLQARLSVQPATSSASQMPSLSVSLSTTMPSTQVSQMPSVKVQLPSSSVAVASKLQAVSSVQPAISSLLQMPSPSLSSTTTESPKQISQFPSARTHEPSSSVAFSLKLQARESVQPASSSSLQMPSSSSSLAMTDPVPSCSPEHVAQSVSGYWQRVLSVSVVEVLS